MHYYSILKKLFKFWNAIYLQLKRRISDMKPKWLQHTESPAEGNNDAVRDVVSPVKLTISNLLNTYTNLEPIIREDKTNASFMVSTLVIKHFLGIEWVERNLYPRPNGGGFMQLDEVITEHTQIKAFRVIDLAELLINLQYIEGFEPLIYRMRNDSPEACLAELRVGRILYINDVKFRFVTPAGRTGEDYDLEVTYPDGTIVCAETKCKIESTEASAATIYNALNQARKQLPKDKPGIIFVMVPQRWLEIGAEKLMVESANTFFKGNANKPPASKIVSIKYYTEPLAFSDGIISQAHKYKEISNPDNKFHPNRNWNLLHYKPALDRPTPDKWDALPDKWIRLVNFPYELKIPESS